MKKAAILLSLAMIIFAEPDLIVLNGLGETLSLGGWGTALHNDVMTTGSMPNQVIWSGEDWDFFVVNSGNSTVQKCFVEGGGIVLEDTYLLPEGSNPYLAYFDLPSDMLVVSLWVTGQIAIIDDETGDIAVTEPLFETVQGVYTDGDFIYATDAHFDSETFIYGTGMLYKLSLEGVILDSVEIGMNPQEIIADRGGNLHIVCTGDYFSVLGEVHIIDPATLAPLETLSIGGNPARLTMDIMTGLVYSATSVWGTSGSGRLLSYDPSDFSIIHSTEIDPVEIAGTGLTGLAAFNNTVIIPSMDSSWVEYYDVSAGEVREVFDAGYGSNDAVFIGDMTCEDVPELPAVREIASAYPNPFNSTCNINIDAETIEIFDVRGNLVDVLEENKTWRPSDKTPTGVYLARAKGSKTQPLKLIYAK